MKCYFMNVRMFRPLCKLMELKPIVLMVSESISEEKSISFILCSKLYVCLIVFTNEGRGNRIMVSVFVCQAGRPGSHPARSHPAHLD